MSRAREFFVLGEMLLHVPKDGHPTARKQRQPLNGEQRSKVIGRTNKLVCFEVLPENQDFYMYLVALVTRTL